jgi:biotin carboxyl carrier protein
MRRPDLIRSGNHGGRQATTSGGHSYEVTITPGASGQLAVTIGGVHYTVTVNGRARRRRDEAGGSNIGPDRVTTPMPGKVIRVLVAPGDAVRARQPLVVVEAMKMENELRAGRDGIVSEIHVTEGASVEAGALLFEIR